MFTKHLKRLLVLILVCTLAGSSAFANGLADRQSETKISQPAMANDIALKTAQPHDKLRADMQKLLAEAKAGRVVLTAGPQIQPAKGNNLSKKAKVAIGVGIAVTIVAVILVVKIKRDGFFNCKSRCVL